MKTKYIEFTAPKVAEFKEEPVAEISDNQLIVALECSSISSGTERANLIGNKNLSIYASCLSPYPIRLGYSSAGRVIKIGSAVTNVKVGDRVAVFWSKHTKYFVANSDQVVKLPDNVSYSDGALTHIACFPMAAIRKCRLEIGESAVVMGLGVLGMLGVKLLKCAGAAPIIAVDPVKERRDRAIKMGTDYALDPYADDFKEKAIELTGGGASVGIEVTGVGAGLDGILDVMAPFGRVALLGCTRDSNFTIDYYHKVHARGITLVGAHTMARPKCESHNGWWTTQDDMSAIIKLISLGRLNFSSMVESVCSPKDCAEVYLRLAEDKAFPLTQFDWSDIE